MKIFKDGLMLSYDFEIMLKANYKICFYTSKTNNNKYRN